MILEAVGIVATNIKNSVKFYSLLGLKFPELNEEDDHVEAVTSTGLRVMLDSESLMKKLKPNWIKPIGQRTTLAFLCKSPVEVDEVYSKLIQAGFEGEKAPWDAFWGQRYACILDPDGNSVDIFAPLS